MSRVVVANAVVVGAATPGSSEWTFEAELFDMGAVNADGGPASVQVTSVSAFGAANAGPGQMFVIAVNRDAWLAYKTIGGARTIAGLRAVNVSTPAAVRLVGSWQASSTAGTSAGHVRTTAFATGTVASFDPVHPFFVHANEILVACYSWTGGASTYWSVAAEVVGGRASIPLAGGAR